MGPLHTYITMGPIKTAEIVSLRQLRTAVVNEAILTETIILRVNLSAQQVYHSKEAQPVELMEVGKQGTFLSVTPRPGPSQLG